MAASFVVGPSDETLLRSWLRHMISDVHWRAYEKLNICLNDMSFDNVQVDFDDASKFYVRSLGGVREHMTRSTYVMTTHEVPPALQYLLVNIADQNKFIESIEVIGITVTRFIDKTDRFADYVVCEDEIPETFSESDCE